MIELTDKGGEKIDKLDKLDKLDGLDKWTGGQVVHENFSWVFVPSSWIFVIYFPFLNK